MIAVLLYLIGLISTLVTVVMVGLDAPAIYAAVVAALQPGIGEALPALGRLASSYQWALTPFLGGLLLMGFGRIMMLLGAINRALRHPI